MSRTLVCTTRKLTFTRSTFAEREPHEHPEDDHERDEPRRRPSAAPRRVRRRRRPRAQRYARATQRRWDRTRRTTASRTAASASESRTPRAVIEREPARRHVGDRDRAHARLARRDRGLGNDRHARARGDEVADEPDALDLDRHRAT